MKTLFFAMFIAYGLGALAALVSGRKSLGRGSVALGAIAGAGAGLALGATVITTGVPGPEVRNRSATSLTTC